MSGSQGYFLIKALAGWREAKLMDAEAATPPSGSIQSLPDLLEHLDGITTVTIDVFDTLLRRDVEPPDRTRCAALVQLSLALNRAGLSLGVRNLREMRAEAEAKARQDALANGGDAECNLTEIFTQLYFDIRSGFGVDPAVQLPLPKLVDFEVEVECARLSLMPGADKLLDELRARGLRTFLISDMYLEDYQLRRILKHHGLLDRVSGCYVSSTTRLSKGSGSIFRHLADTGVLQPGETMHLGDHVVSDLQRPRENGLKALLFHDPEEHMRRARLARAVQIAETLGESSVLRHMHQLRARTADESSARSIGYHRLGPVFTLFGLDILRDALSHEYREVYFLARDGYLLQRLYEKLRHGLDMARLLPTPAGRYLYLSRASTRLVEIGDSAEQLSSLAQRVNRQAGVWALIDILGLDRDSYRPLLKKALKGVDLDLAGDENGELQQSLLRNTAFRQRLHTDIAAGRANLRDYLLQEGLLAPGQVMIADIGWNGSILATLEKAFGDSPRFPRIRARFLGRLYGTRTELIEIAPGFACDGRRNNPVEHLINECRELFETVSSSLEGSVLGYLRKDGRLSPRRSIPSLSPEERTLIESLQEGILDYCDDFVSLYNRFVPDPEALLPEAVLQAVSLIVGSDPAEQAQLAKLSFDLGWGTEGRVSLREYLGLADSKHVPSVQKLPPLQFALADQAEAGGDGLQRLFEGIHRTVERLRQEDALVFYGVGTVTSLLAPLLQERIDYFVDGNSALHGQQFLGKPILSPDVLQDESGRTVFVTPIQRKRVIANRLAGCKLPVLYIDDLM